MAHQNNLIFKNRGVITMLKPLNSTQHVKIDHLAHTFKPQTMKSGYLEIIDLFDYDYQNSPHEFQDFIDACFNCGLHYALEYDLNNVMDDEQSAIYPLVPAALEHLTDTSISGVDNSTAHAVLPIINKLNVIGVPNYKIDTYFFNIDNRPIEKGEI